MKATQTKAIAPVLWQRTNIDHNQAISRRRVETVAKKKLKLALRFLRAFFGCLLS